MIQKIMTIAVLLCLVLSVCSCSDQTNVYGNEENTVGEDTFVEENDKFTVLKEERNYTISYKSTGLDKYKTDFFDDNGDVIDTVYTRLEPQILRDNENVIGFWAQAGTGVSTRYAVFYNTENGKRSDEFSYYLDVCDGLIAIGDTNGVIIRDIFDSEKYYKEIMSFSKKIDTSLANGVTAEFSADGRRIAVTYRINPHESRTEEFDL